MNDREQPRRSKVGRVVTRVAVILLLSWLGLSLLAALFYPLLLYHPDRRAGTATPSLFAPGYEDLRLTAPDGVGLHAWFVPAPESAKTGYTLLVFHGNAGNLSTAVERLRIYHNLGLDVFIVDYHGFGQSGGEPSEANLYLDAETAWTHLARGRGVPADRIVVLGYSLGGAVASRLARDHPDIAGLVLESTFTRLADVAAALFPWLPCGLILGDAYDTLGRLPGLSMPLLVVHGRGDELVPFALGVRIHDAYRGPKSFVRIGDDHNLGFVIADEAYREGLRSFLSSLHSPTSR